MSVMFALKAVAVHDIRQRRCQQRRDVQPRQGTHEEHSPIANTYQNKY